MKLVTEVYRLALVASVPAALMLAFPFRAIGFKADRTPAHEHPGHCRFVELTAEEEAQALLAARASWSTDADELRQVRLELLERDLPAPELGALIDCRFESAADCPVSFTPELLPASLGAPDAKKLEALPAKPETKGPAFSREEMLKID